MKMNKKDEEEDEDETERVAELPYFKKEMVGWQCKISLWLLVEDDWLNLSFVSVSSVRLL